MKVAVFVCVDRIDLQTDHAEVFACQFAGFPDICYVALGTAFAGENQDFFHAAVRDDLHFMFNLLGSQLHAVDVVVTVKTAVNAVILTVVRDVERSKQVDRVSKVFACLQTGSLCHLLQKRFGGRGEQRFEIVNGTGFML